MKKLLALLLGATMVMSLAACGGNKPAETKAPETKAEEKETKGETEAAGEETADAEGELVFMFWGNQTRTERTTAASELYTEAHPTVTFDLQNVDWGNYWTVLATKAAGNEMPDIVQMDYKYLNAYAENGSLVVLDDYIASGAIDTKDVEDTVINMGKVGDKVYAICNGVNVPCFMYDGAAAEAAGIEVKDNMTLDEFIEYSKAITEATGKTARLQYRSETLLQYLLRGAGEHLFNEANDDLGCSIEELEKYFALFADGTEEGWMMPITLLGDVDIYAVEQDPFVYSIGGNNSWCTLAWSNQITAYLNASPDELKENFKVTTWPAEDPTLADYIKPSQFWSIGNNTDFQDQSADVIDFLTNSVECNEILLGERGIPISNAVSSAIADKLDQGAQMAIALIQDVVAPNCSDIDPAAPGTAKEFFTLLDDLVEQVCHGAISVSDAANKALTQGSEIVKG